MTKTYIHCQTAEVTRQPERMLAFQYLVACFMGGITLGHGALTGYRRFVLEVGELAAIWATAIVPHEEMKGC